MTNPKIILFPTACQKHPPSSGQVNLSGVDSSTSDPFYPRTWPNTTGFDRAILVTVLKLDQVANAMFDIATALGMVVFGILVLLGVALAFTALGLEIVSAFH